MIDKKRRSFASLVAVALSSLVGLGPLLAGEDVSFMDPIDFGVGRSPQSVAVGDFNGDKALDLVVANEGSNNVSILLGKGSGAFGAAREFAVGRNPYFVAVGDFNDDKVLDLAVANSGSNNVSILLGKGDGTFEPAKNFDVGRTPRTIAISDFDGDGISDLAVANEGSNNVSILFGRKDGTFAAGPTIGVDGSPTAVAAADLDGDGAQDLAVVILGRIIFGGGLNEPGKVSILLGNGGGTFRPPQSYRVGVNPRSSPVISDLNGDKILDLAVANRGSDNISVLLGKGDGTFEAARNYQVSGFPKSVAVGDFNGDGIPDLVTASRFSCGSILIGKGDGTFQPTQDFWAGADLVSVAVGDFNKDGRPDLAVADWYSNNVSILLNNTPQTGDGVTIIRDIIYYDGPYANPQRQRLDLYLPADKTDFPVVFLVYGGGWIIGDKSRSGYFARTLAREGLGVVAISHRLTDGGPEQVVHPGHISDVARAFAWMYNHMADYGGNRDETTLIGHSSGCTLVALLATDRRYLAAQRLSAGVIKGVIGVDCYYDLRTISVGLYPFIPSTVGDTEQRWEASPIKYVGERQPPFQLLCETADDPGFCRQASLFYDALVAAGTEVERHEIADRNHNTIIGRAARPGDPARELMLRFIADHTAAKP